MVGIDGPPFQFYCPISHFIFPKDTGLVYCQAGFISRDLHIHILLCQLGEASSYTRQAPYKHKECKGLVPLTPVHISQMGVVHAYILYESNGGVVVRAEPTYPLGTVPWAHDF